MTRIAPEASAASARRIALLGGGGHASEILGLLEALMAKEDRFEIFIGDDAWSNRRRFAGRPATLGTVDQALEAAAEHLGATGYPSTRRALVQRALQHDSRAADALVHPSAETSTGVQLSAGVVVQGQSWLSPLVQIGEHSYIGYGAKVGHDTIVGEFCSLMPGSFVGGDAAIGNDVLIGAGAVVLQGIHIGDGAVVGAGATVTSDVAPQTTVVGTPAHELAT